MSFRVFGREVETTFLDFLIEELYSWGILEGRADYLSSSKNAQVADFYEQVGFEMVCNTPSRTKYKIDVAGYTPKKSEYIELNNLGSCIEESSC